MTRRVLARAEELRDVLGIDFSAQQLQAITAPLEPGVIIAGAGSGKTTVMAARVVWLVGCGQLRPDQVLGLTFTRKAAAELSGRVRRALVTAGVLSADGEDGEELILTYDSYAGRLVAESGLLLGFEGDARLITGAARYRLASRVVSDARGPFRFISRLRPDTVTERVLALDAELRSHLVEPSRLVTHAKHFLATVEAAPRNPRGSVYAALQTARAVAQERLELAELVSDYSALKERLGYVEFADQMARAARLAVEVPQVAIGQRGRFAVVLLDEYQDTSSAQATLLRALFSGSSPDHGRGHPVTAVGDPCQAIYGWRGAAASNILEFPSAFPTVDGQPARRYALTVNRRSGQRILDAANHLAGPVRRDPALSAHGLNLDLMAPDDTPPGRVEVASFATWPEELAATADQIADLQSTGAVRRWSDIAVLTRRNSQVAAVFSELVARDIPAEIVGLGGLLDLPAVAEVVATLTLLDDVTANPALIRLITSPRWAVGLPDLALLGRRSRDLASQQPSGGDPLIDALAEAASAGDPAQVGSLLEAAEDPGDEPFSQAALDRFAAFTAELRELRRHAGESVVDLTHRIIATLGLDVELRVGAAGAPRDAQCLPAFVRAVADYADTDGEASLSGLLAYLEAEREHGVGLEQAVQSSEDSVKLLTVHKAKGLEWEVVFLPGLAADVFPTDRVTGNWLRNAAVVPSPLRGDGAAIPQLAEVTHQAAVAFAEDLTADQRRSEDRLAYVAVTRARQRLVATTHVWAGDLVRPRTSSDYFRALDDRAQVRRDMPPVPGENPLVGPPTAAAWPLQPSAESVLARQEAAAEVAWARAERRRTGAYPVVQLSHGDDADLVREWDLWIDSLAGEAGRGSRRRRRVPLPDHLSVTGVTRAVAEPARYARELARPLPRLVSDAERRGLAFHRWLERRFRQQVSLFAEDGDPAGDDNLIAPLCAAFEASRYAGTSPVAVEAPFTVLLAGRLVRGRIDAVFKGDSGHDYQVVDWKTGDAERADPLQLALYRLAWAELEGLPLDRVDAVFVDLRRDLVVRPKGLPGREELERLVAALGTRG